MIRAFVALPVPPGMVPSLLGAQKGLPVGRAAVPENFHVTLAFLGAHPEPVIEDMHHALDTIAASAVPVGMSGIGMFGGREPRTLHAEITPSAEMSHLRRKVMRAARETGIEPDGRRHHPHVTLARFERGMGPEDLTRLHDFIAGRVGMTVAAEPVAEFGLYESHLGRAGPVYELLASYPLGPG